MSQSNTIGRREDNTIGYRPWLLTWFADKWQ